MIRRAHGPGTAFLVTACAAAFIATGCNSTTYDTSATTAPSVTPTTYIATGTPAELLAMMADEVAGLSEQLVEGDGQHDTMDRIAAQWAVVRPTIQDDHPELLQGFDSAMGQVERAVERRRPADADKASKSLTALIAAIDP